MVVLPKKEDELFPFWSLVDTLVEKKIKDIVTPGQYRLFDSCRRKLVCLWYIHKRIFELYSKYTGLGKELLSSPEKEIKQLVYIKPLGPHEYRYDAYWEAIEFEHLLSQAKACTDIFARAVGVFFKNSASNLQKLEKVLERVRGENKDIARKILIQIDNNKKYLKGIILPPDQHNKNQSLRDLLTHYESLDVWFKIRLRGGKGDVGVFGGFVDTRGIMVPNFKAINISQALWFGVKRMVEGSFAVLAKVNLRY